MQGFVGFNMPVWVRRLITMVPAFVIALSCNATTAMVLSQVVLSFVLPLPLITLVVLSSRESVMGDCVASKATAVAAVVATILIVLLNVVLISQIVR
jgi:manganese transport protein